jgi:hypothetical protein
MNSIFFSNVSRVLSTNKYKNDLSSCKFYLKKTKPLKIKLMMRKNIPTGMDWIIGWFDSFFFSFIVGGLIGWYGVNYNKYLELIQNVKIFSFTLISVCLWLNWYARGLWKTMIDVKHVQKSSKFIQIFDNWLEFCCSLLFAIVGGTSIENVVVAIPADFRLD